MPGVSTPQLLSYAEIVDVDLDATNDVNFADVEDYGHRVQVEMDIGSINSYLRWTRAVGTARPVAALESANEGLFKAALEGALSGGYVDIDGVTGGLHFGTANMDTNPDPRKRADGISANDLPMCFVLYKLYGSSAVATLDNIFNLGDAHGMLLNATVATAVTESFKAEVSGALDTMFRDLLASDPHRFFDVSGIPEAGIFETNADVSGSGSWKLTENDTLEVKIKMTFNSRVSRRGVAGMEHNLTSTASEDDAASQPNQQTVISPGDYFYVRLQIKATTIYQEVSYTPNLGSGLALWLDANDANTFTLGANNAVTFWGDKSGNSRNGITMSGTVQRQATSFNGKPSVYFSYGSMESAANVFSGITSSTATVSAFMVARHPHNAGQPVPRFLLVGNARIIAAGEGAPLSVLRSISGGWENSPAINSGATNTNYLVFAQQNPLKDIITLNATTTSEVNSGRWVNYNGDWRIGIRNSTNAEMNGNIAEVLLFIGAMSTEQRQKVEGYLAHKWGLAANLPADHPYKAAGPTVLVAL